MLHKDDSLNIINEMSVKTANKFCKAFFILTGKNVEDVSFDYLVKFKNENWFRLPKVGMKTLEDFENAVLKASGSHAA